MTAEDPDTSRRTARRCRRLDAQRHAVLFYLSVGLIAGAIIALQIAVMRIFSIASWAHFGSLVISIAMLGFGIASAVMCVGKARIERNQDLLAKICLLSFGPLLAAANGLAQMVPFNPIFLVSDPQQKLRLLANFLLYFSPFLPGAVFLGLAFLRGQKAFGRVYFADLAGSGLGGLSFLGALYLLPPERLLLVPWRSGSSAGSSGSGCSAIAAVSSCCCWLARWASLAQLRAAADRSSPYKGVSYARHFPDAERIYQAASPFGDLEVYRSSYFHFAPGLSDMAAINLPTMPIDAYLGMFIDGDGPIGIIKTLPDDQTAYFRFLPMYLPYVVKKDPRGLRHPVRRRHLHQPGAAQRRHLRDGGREPIRWCCRPCAIRQIAGADRPYAGRSPRQPGAVRRTALCAARCPTASISSISASRIPPASPTPAAIRSSRITAIPARPWRAIMRALKPGGILAVTIWNKEDPPKSAIRLFTTMTEAGRGWSMTARSPIASISATPISAPDGALSARRLQRGGDRRLDAHDKAMAFDVVYEPGRAYVGKTPADLYSRYRDNFFATSNSSPGSNPGGAAAGSAAPTAGADATAPAAAVVRAGRRISGPSSWRGRTARMAAIRTAIRPRLTAAIPTTTLPPTTTTPWARSTR